MLGETTLSHGMRLWGSCGHQAHDRGKGYVLGRGKRELRFFLSSTLEPRRLLMILIRVKNP